MILIRAILLLLHFTVVPVAVGRLITYKADETIHRNPIVTYMAGLFGSWGIFYVLFAVIEWHQNWNTFNDPYFGCFSILVNVYSVVIAILTVAAIIIDRKRIVVFFKGLHIKKANSYVYIYGAIFALIVLVELYFAYGYQINQWSYDDYDYVVGSLDNLTSDSINYTNMITGEQPYTLYKRSSASWTTYISYLAKVSDFEVTTICHTILPVLLLLVAYAVYYYMAQLLFKDTQARLNFMIILVTLYAFGLYSHYSVSFRLLCALWQGKGVLSAIVIPFLFVYLVQLYSREIHVKNIFTIVMISLGMCSLTVMSTFLVVSVQVLMWVVVSIRNRKITNVMYLLAGMAGPILQMILYVLSYMLLIDMRGNGTKFFKNR